MSHHARAWLTSVFLTLACTAASKPESKPDTTPERDEGEADETICPIAVIHEALAPDVTPAMEHAEFWLAKLEPGQADALLIGPAEREVIAQRVASTPGSWRDPIDPALADPPHVDAELHERLDWLRGRVATGKYVEGQPEALELAAHVITTAKSVPEAEALRFIVAETPLWCVPTTAGLYTTPVDAAFDRNLCASLHPGELVRLLRKSGEWGYVDAGHGVGWIALGEPSAIGVPIDRAVLQAERAGDHFWVLDDWSPHESPDITLRAGTRFARQGDVLHLPRAGGLDAFRIGPDEPFAREPLPLTRRTLFEQAFAQIGDSYGWGGHAGQRDCSALVFDLFGQFDLLLARNSAVQSQLGVHTIEVAGQSEAAKRDAIRAAAQRGAVLLWMPGHIMLYLGHHSIDGVERDYGLSALSEYLVPCPGGPDTVHRLDRVAVTTLELGRGSERKAYIERIERLAVFGPLSE